MKKILYILVFFMMLFSFENTYAQITEHKNNSRLKIFATSYPNYKPFFYQINKGNYNEYTSVFTDVIDEVLLTNNIYADYVSTNNYEQNINLLKEGEYDLLIGMYNETHTDIKLLDHMEYIYPAFLNNPINIIMLPKNISKIKNLEDLKKLKGVYVSSEYFSDYVYSQLDNLGVKPNDNVFDTYKMLFSQEIDYIIGSYYFHYIQAVEIGVKDYISFSKKPIWNIPMFVGISKRSKNYQRLKVLLSKKVANIDFSNNIKEKLKNHIKEIEQQNIGTVPPTFILNKDESIEIY